MNNDHFAKLFDLYYEGKASSQERDEFLMMLNTHQHDELSYKLIDEYYARFELKNKPFDDDRELQQIRYILSSNSNVNVPTKRLQLRNLLPYVAAIFLITLTGLWFYFSSRKSTNEDIVNLKIEEVLPGGNRATLTLSDGQEVNLSASQNGIIAGKEIVYSDGSKVLKEKEASRVENTNYYTLSTPRGGTYQITLPDGTQVWLNSASKLKYPSKFKGNERVVDISGEAYFSVTKDKDRPFKVFSKGQKIEVLGTQFNVSTYESAVKTTLVEGTVKVVNLESNVMKKLKPGQQAALSGALASVETVDVEPIIAWKEGYFYFSGELQDILQQVSRWYDVKVQYDTDTHGHLRLDGRVSRQLTLNKLLKYLKEATGNVQLELQVVNGERRIIVK